MFNPAPFSSIPQFFCGDEWHSQLFVGFMSCKERRLDLFHCIYDNTLNTSLSVDKAIYCG